MPSCLPSVLIGCPSIYRRFFSVHCVWCTHLNSFMDKKSIFREVYEEWLPLFKKLFKKLFNSVNKYLNEDLLPFEEITNNKNISPTIRLFLKIIFWILRVFVILFISCIYFIIVAAGMFLVTAIMIFIANLLIG